MKNIISDDSSYKFTYKLPSQNILEFEFSFKKGENFELILNQTFEQEKIPRILLPDINNLMTFLLREKAKDKQTLSLQQRQNIENRKFFLNVINEWESINNHKNKTERKF